MSNQADTAAGAVRAAINSVPAWRGRATRFAPVGGGLSNSNWRVHVEGDARQYFLKVPGAGTDAFIDRGNAHEAALRAGAIGVSPEVIAFFPDTGVEIIEFLDDYRACTNGDVKSPDISASIIALYRAFNSTPPLPATKTVLDMIEEHRDQAAQQGLALPANMSVLDREAGAARQALLASGLDLAPCHNDPMPGNFLISDGKPMRLIDFEYASNNERAYELAVMTTEFFYDERRVLECIEQFYGTTSWSLVSRVQVCSALADVKWGLWGCLKAQLENEWDYDYQKYGLWKLARARAKMADPRWQLWLASL